MAKKVVEPPEVGDEVMFWRRSPGQKSEAVIAVVLEVVDQWVYVKRLDTGEKRHVDANRLRVTKLAPYKEGSE